MKNSLLKLIALGMVCATSVSAQTHRFDFETYDTTPYLFRFGNKGKKGEHTYKPRWMYSHVVKQNPQSNSDNPSSKVLHYTTQEARNYGLKFRFPTPLPIDQLQEVRFRIFQPANIIGKVFDPAYSSASPTKQQIAIKLLSAFNSVVDFKQDEGILMYLSTVDHTETGVWKTYSFPFKKADYSSQINKFANGVLGIAILPTYGGETTLAEADQYECYIDDIEINPQPLSIGDLQSDRPTVLYADGAIRISSSTAAVGTLCVSDPEGRVLYANSEFAFQVGENSLSLPLPKGLYLISIENTEIRQTEKIVVCP